MNQRESENAASWFSKLSWSTLSITATTSFISLSGEVACYPERGTLGIGLPLLEIVNTRFRRILWRKPFLCLLIDAAPLLQLL